MRIIFAFVCMAYLARSAFSGDNDDPLKQSDLQKEQESGRNLDGRSPKKKTEVKVNDVSEVKLTEKNEFEEIVVTMSQEYLDSQNMQNSLGKMLWQIQVDMQKDNTESRLDFSKESNSTLLSVVIVQDNEVKEFRLPGTKVKDLGRTLTMCPGKEIDKDSKLLIFLVSTADFAINVRVQATLVKEGGAWEETRKDGFPIMKIKGELEFSNPIIHTVHLDRLDLNAIDHYVNLRIESADDSPCFCSILSVQKAECPYYDTIGDAQQHGRWQTMDQTTSMVIDTSEFVTNGDWKEGKLLIVLIAAEDKICKFENVEKRNKTCESRRQRSGEALRKNVTITLEPTAKTHTRWTATMVVLGVYLIFAIGSSISSVYLFKLDALQGDEKTSFWSLCGLCEKNCYLTCLYWCSPEKVATIEDKTKRKTLEKRTERVNGPEKSKARYKKNQLFMGGLLIISIFYATTVLQTAFHAQRTQYESGNNDICYYNARCQIPLRYSSWFLDFNHFYSNIGYIILGITFNVIVYRKNKKYQEQAKEVINKNKNKTNMQSNNKPENNEIDIEAQPKSEPKNKVNFKEEAQSANHEETNVTKEDLKQRGLQSSCFSKLKRNRVSLRQTEELIYPYGVPFLTGVYYSMGAAMVMEGVMSACYHICPTTISFQYDTTFMYVIAILIYVKLYQNRHPDSSASSVKAYLVLGYAVAAEALSIYLGSSPAFWIIFCTFYFVAVILVAVNIYSLDSGRRADVKDRGEKPKSWLDKIFCLRVIRLFFEELREDKNDGCCSTTRPLLGFISLLCIGNIGFCLYLAMVGLSTKYITASTYILYLFMGNMFIYLAYYIAMKYRQKEWLEWRPKLYLGKFGSFDKRWLGVSSYLIVFAAIGIACSIPAMHYFTDIEKDSNVSAAESRDLNGPCQLFDFYDK